MNKTGVERLILSKRTRYKTRLIVFAVLMVAVLALLSACASTTVSETGLTICRELERDLPTYSVNDTDETLLSGARFIEVFFAVCGGQTMR